MKDHITRPLTNVIEATNASMRVLIEEVRTEPSKEGLNRLFASADSLSSAVTALARHVDLSVAPTVAPRRVDVRIYEIVERVCDLLDNGVCGACGGILEPVPEEVPVSEVKRSTKPPSALPDVLAPTESLTEEEEIVIDVETRITLIADELNKAKLSLRGKPHRYSKFNMLDLIDLLQNKQLAARASKLAGFSNVRSSVDLNVWSDNGTALGDHNLMTIPEIIGQFALPEQ